MITGASAEGMVMLVIEALDGATVECAGALVACEQAAARRVRPELPAAFDSPDFCMAALQRLWDSGHHGLVVMGNGRAAAVMAAAARENPAVGRYALLLAEGPAGEPARIRRRPLNTDHHALPGSRAPGIRRGPLRRSCGRLPLSYIEGRAFCGVGCGVIRVTSLLGAGIMARWVPLSSGVDPAYWCCDSGW
jgi:hypothetical protein